MKKNIYILLFLLVIFASNNTFSQDTSKPVGKINGSIDVSATGAATYSIPIAVPPGTKGVQPNISLVYSSQGGVGVMGKGWNISGLSSISRSGKTIFHNDKVEGIKFDDSDNFVYDGMVLVPVVGENGQDNTEYRTEIESYIKCYSSGRIGNSPANFVVKLKNGSTIYYGTDNSRANIASRTEAISWNISKIIDEFGNYMTFSYINNSTTTGELLISEINYTGNIGLAQAPYNKVVFEYEETNMFGKCYFDGNEYQKTKRLKYVKTYTDNSLVKTYEVLYDNNTSNTLFSVKEIKEINYTGEELNSTKFDWEKSVNTDISFQNINYINGLNFSMFSPGEDPTEDERPNNWFRSGDIDGDGDNDIVLVGRLSLNSNMSVFVYKNNGDGTFNPLELMYTYTTALSDNLTDIYLIDWDRDGKSDLLSVHSNGIQLLQYNINSNMFEFDKVIVEENIMFTSRGLGYGYSFSDINGDGILDLIKVENTGVKYRFGNESGTFQYISYAYEKNFNYFFEDDKHRLFFGDVNRDGMSDMVVFHTNCVFVYLANGNGFDDPKVWTIGFTSNNGWGVKHDIQLVDINGDGMCDIAGLGENAYVVYLSNGVNSFESEDAYTIAVSGWQQPKYPWYHVDLNNDGLVDILAFGDQSTIAYLNSGSQFEPKFSAYFFSGSESRKWPRIIADLNGDFIPDILKIEYSGNSKIAFGEKNDNILISSVTDGFNNNINVEYDIFRKSFYQHTLTYPFSTLAGISLVKSLKSYSQGNLISNLDYLFEKPVSNLNGKGFLGFQKMQVIDLINQTNIINTSSLVKNIASLIPETKTFMYNNIQNKSTKTTYSYDIVQISLRKRFRVNKTHESVINEFEHTNSTSDWTYDDNGNVTQILNDIYPYNSGVMTPNIFIKTTNNILYTNVDNVWNFKPTYSYIEIKNEKNKTDKKITYYEYLNNKLYKEKHHFTNDTLKNEIIYESYNSFGMPQTVTHKTMAMSRVSQFEYGTNSKGRWVTKETDYIGVPTSYEYEPKYGNCTKKITVGDLTTNYNYDGWGRLTSTVLPDGETITNSYVWGSNSSVTVPNALYSVINSSNRNGSVVTTYDALGREIQVKDATTPMISFVETRYNNKGLVEKKTLPYSVEGTSDASKKWAEFTYDQQNRVISETSPILLNNTYQYTEGTFTNSVIKTNNIDVSATTQVYNYLGQLEKSTDNGGDITYTYTSSGKPDTISTLNGKTIITYDEAGNRRSITEPNSGSKYSYYNGYGDFTKNVDKKGVVSTYTYSPFGRLNSMKLTSIDGSYETTNTYETASISSKGMLKSQKITEKNINNIIISEITTSYAYDALGRATQITETLDGKNFVKDIGYNTLGQLSNVTYPSYNVTNRVSIDYFYNSLGQERIIKKGTQTLWERKTDNIYGLPVRVELGNNTGTKYSYNDNNQITTIQSGILTDIGSAPIILSLNYIDPPPTEKNIGSNIQKWVYEYNPKGLMSSRKDSIYNQKESFSYDNLNRLTSIRKLNGGQFYNDRFNNISYDNQGNIKSKSDVGTYSYVSDNKPNAISGINNTSFDLLSPPFFNTISTEPLVTTYNSYNKIDKITKGTKEIQFYYNSAQERIKTVYKLNNVIQKTTYYIGNYECEVYPNGRVRELNYISTSTGHTIVELKDNNQGVSTDSIYYIFKDHLGSYDRVVNQLGQIVQVYSFDAWGNRRTANNWQVKDVTTTRLFNRGFTGHEHLDDFEIINMNGRLYDPVIGRFFSPDPYVASNTFTQDFNRYSYCRNNPLLYTDPSGEFIHLILGAAIGGFCNWGLNGAEFSLRGLGYFGVGALSGALGAGIGVGIQTAFAGASFWASFVGCPQGISTILASGATSFLSGAAAGAAGGATGGFISGFGNGLLGEQSTESALKNGLLNGAIGGVSGALIGGIIGGIDARNQGRDFWDGSKTTYKTLVEQNIPQVSQNGAMNCGPACVEAVDRSFGGNITQQQIREMVVSGSNPDTEALSVGKIWDSYNKNNTTRIARLLKPEYQTSETVLSLMKNDYRVVVNLDLNKSSGHAVIMKSIVEKTVLKINRSITTSLIYNVMDPAGSYISISPKSISNALGIIFVK